ncbi:MAG: carbamoyltransferase HypF, partial [Roseinatronobacter sp.]|nr:carbamoyltransferase HypF [Roseinatronobacter sp.]
AARFHATMAECFAHPARQLLEDGRAKAVVLTGGCFQNAVLLDYTLQALQGYRVLTQTRLPANDGSLAFGQALICSLAPKNAGSS